MLGSLTYARQAIWKGSSHTKVSTARTAQATNGLSHHPPVWEPEPSSSSLHWKMASMSSLVSITLDDRPAHRDTSQLKALPGFERARPVHSLMQQSISQGNSMPEPQSRHNMENVKHEVKRRSYAERSCSDI